MQCNLVGLALACGAQLYRRPAVAGENEAALELGEEPSVDRGCDPCVSLLTSPRTRNTLPARVLPFGIAVTYSADTLSDSRCNSHRERAGWFPLPLAPTAPVCWNPRPIVLPTPSATAPEPSDTAPTAPPSRYSFRLERASDGSVGMVDSPAVIDNLAVFSFRDFPVTFLADYNPGQVEQFLYSIDQPSRTFNLSVGGGSSPSGSRSTTYEFSGPIQKLELWLFLRQPTSDTKVFTNDVQMHEIK